jgi:curved DNA-binding protein CbpA
MRAKFVLVGPRESDFPLQDYAPPLSTSEVKRRTTRILCSIPLIVSWVDGRKGSIVEETATVSVNCHGFQYFSRQRPQKNTPVTFQITENKEDKSTDQLRREGRVAWVRKSRRLAGLYLVGIELSEPSNIWSIEETPEDWAEFSPPTGEDPACFLAEVDRILKSTHTATFYELLGVEVTASHSELKRHFYGLARSFHPDRHMDRPEWTPRLLALMESVTTAYKTLSDEEAKKEYDRHLARQAGEGLSSARNEAQRYLSKAEECIGQKNFSGGILWLHRVIDCEPRSSSHRARLGWCLSAIPEYWKEAAEQFEMAIDLDPRNVNAHFHFAELLEYMNVPWRARSHYLCVLELDRNHWEARQRVDRLAAGTPRAASRVSLLRRLTGRR